MADDEKKVEIFYDKSKLNDDYGGEVDTIIADLDQQLAEHPNEPGFHIPKVKFRSQKHATFVIALFASMGGLLSGLDQSLISGANLYMPKTLHMDSDQDSLVSSMMPLGAVLGCLILSPSNEYFGRRKSILWACLFYTIGAALEAGAISYGMMIAGRFVLGMGLGLEGGTVPMYVAECVPSAVRGRVVSLYQFNIALGEVFGYCVGAIFVDVKGNWRYMLGSSLVFSTVMVFGMLVLSETPRWLIHKGRELDAYRVWKNLRGSSTEANLEFLETRRAAIEEKNQDHHEKKFVWLDFFRVPRCRRALVYANIMIMLGQMTGVNGLLYYLSILINQIGFNDKQSILMSLVGGGALLLGTIPAILYMDRAGRRFWANFTLPGFFIGLLLVGVSYVVPASNLVAVEGVYFTGMIMYFFFFGSYATLTWVIPSESYPTYLRSYGMTTSSATLFLWSFIVTFNFSRMQEAMGKIGLTLGFYGAIAVVGWFYQLFFMPETKGKTLEEIDLIFERPTKEIVAENMHSIRQGFSDIVHFRFRNLVK
ncbi:myo-inositol transporter ITR2 [Sugiyamaella lignohabitans]|uniref:Myo-inositol transporter ITR2 n=1 Tax=Sugiyamaella lignohabitans TaxID=796027 RepID=A0A167EHM3_9ASCO|nr:myo-inositol transporter ITR2 [Sugiyamaella lignohabitans]ANB14093.1 myo-inositol transporter ITR2 [Sugiyamaella lignohabitans]